MRITAPYSDQEQLADFQQLERDVLYSGRHWALLIVRSGQAGLSPEQRKRQVAWQKTHKEALRKGCAGSAMVIEEISPFMSMAMSLMLSLMGDSAFPTKFFTEEPAGREWLDQQLERHRSAA